MEISSLSAPLRQIRSGAIVIYSLVVAATIIPGVGVPSIIPILYFMFIPGYCIAALLRQTDTILEGLFYSVAWSIAAVASIYSFGSIGYAFLPIAVVLPALTIIILTYDHLHSR